MNPDETGAFDLLATRYLDGELDGDAFEQLQAALRESPDSRRRFLELCRHAQECSEVTDRRAERAAAANAPGRKIARTSAWLWWRPACAAAAAVLLAAVVFWRPSRQEPALAGGGGVPVTPVVAPSESGAPLRISLLEFPSMGFELTPAAVGGSPDWESIDADLGLAKDLEPAASWLDTIGLQVVSLPPQPTRPDDIQL